MIKRSKSRNFLKIEKAEAIEEWCAVVKSSNKRDDGVVTAAAAKVAHKIKSTQLSPSFLMTNLDTQSHTHSHRIPIPSLTSLHKYIPATKFIDYLTYTLAQGV